MSEPASAIVGKVGVSVFQAAAPTALAWLKMQALGRTVLFLGPSRSGKTSFINFVRSGTYADPTENVPRTTKPRNTGSLQLKSRNEQVKIDLKSVVDTKGQDFPSDHAKLVSKHKPHVLCIMLDSTADWSSNSRDSAKNSIRWLEEFAEHLCEIRDEDPNMLRRLKSFVILINKKDASVPDDIVTIKRRERQIRLVIRRHFTGRMGRISAMLNIKSMSLVEDHDGGLSASKAIATTFNPLIRDE